MACSRKKPNNRLKPVNSSCFFFGAGCYSLLVSINSATSLRSFCKFYRSWAASVARMAVRSSFLRDPRDSPSSIPVCGTGSIPVCGAGSIPHLRRTPVKIGGIMLKISLGIQWNLHQKWDSVNYWHYYLIAPPPRAPK